MILAGELPRQPETGAQTNGQTTTHTRGNVLCKFEAWLADYSGLLNPARASEASKQPQQHENDNNQAKYAT